MASASQGRAVRAPEDPAATGGRFGVVAIVKATTDGEPLHGRYPRRAHPRERDATASTSCTATGHGAPPSPARANPSRSTAHRRTGDQSPHRSRARLTHSVAAQVRQSAATVLLAMHSAVRIRCRAARAMRCSGGLLWAGDGRRVGGLRAGYRPGGPDARSADQRLSRGERHVPRAQLGRARERGHLHPDLRGAVQEGRGAVVLDRRRDLRHERLAAGRPQSGAPKRATAARVAGLRDPVRGRGHAGSSGG